MRYPEQAIDAAAGTAVANELIVATVVYTLLVGIVFIAVGYFGRQLWLKAWGGLTVLIATGYLLAVLLGYA